MATSRAWASLRACTVGAISVTAGSTWSSMPSSRSTTDWALRITARASAAVELMLLAASTTAEMAPGRAVIAFTWALASVTPTSSAVSRSDNRGILAMVRG